MREALALERRTALRTRVEPLCETAARAAIDCNPRDIQIVRVHVVIVSGIGDRAAHQLLDRIGRIYLSKLQYDQCFAHALAANRIGDAAKLTRGGTNETQMRNGLLVRSAHVFTVALSPPWPRK